MNPFLYPALIVLILCGLSTASAKTLLAEKSEVAADLIVLPVWFVAGSALSAMALASLTGKGVGATLPAGIALGFWSALAALYRTMMF
jgi:TRAP-type mannitol/chloroaromatic compound transport system permease small subunit